MSCNATGGTQGGAMKLSVFFLSVFLSLFSNLSSAAIPAKIISIPRGSPVFLADGVAVTTVVRGLAANDPARVVTQIIPKTHFLKNLRIGMLAKINPWHVAMWAATGAIMWGLDGLMQDMYKPAPTVGTGMCGTGKPASSISQCLTMEADYLWSIGRGWNDAPYASRVNSSTSGHLVYGENGQYNYMHITFTPSDEPNQDPEPYTDVDLWKDVKQFVADNPNMNHNDMFKDANANPEQDFFQNPEYDPTANEDDLALLDLYKQGLLQSDDVNLPHYVTPEKMAELEALSKDIEDSKTPEGEADALNDKQKQPITQAEFEESTSRHAAQALDGVNKSSIDDTDKTEQLDDDFGVLDALIMNPVGLPSKLPTIPTPQYSSGCRTIDLTYKGYSVAFPSSDQCAKLNEFKKGIGYILYFLTAFGIAVAALRVND